ncbi:hypothetical protein [Bacillus thuringiensis]|uniref:hypothetical protein n=1 Tax=Bacillus thuringiensis TaxID=1428 RepID=UPI0011A9619B|nr:hypothetical protein [Bacillus thuringiensis]
MKQRKWMGFTLAAWLGMSGLVGFSSNTVQAEEIPLTQTITSYGTTYDNHQIPATIHHYVVAPTGIVYGYRTLEEANRALQSFPTQPATNTEDWTGYFYENSGFNGKWFLGVSGGYFNLGNNWWNQRISSLRTPAKDKGVRLYEYGGKKGDSIYFPPNTDVYTLAAYYKGDGQRWDKRIGSIELYR